jgi:tmRNA-binding protein
MFGRVADGRRRVLIPVAMGRGKRLHHKRETEKSRDWNCKKCRHMRERG